MKWICILLAGLTVTSSIAAQSSAADADAAWAEILKAEKANASNAQLPDQLKAFYKAYPDHPKASDAWIHEQSLRPQPALPKTALAPQQTTPPTFEAQVQEAHARIRKAKAAGHEAGLGEMERSGRKLATDYPRHPAGWEILLEAARGFTGDKAGALYMDIASNAPTAQLKAAAITARRAALNPERIVGIPVAQNIPTLPKIKPISLSFTAIDGRQVNLSQYAGKVVLIDFWATWCGPCIMAMPHVKNAYTEFRDQGFEIIGISLDQDPRALSQYVAANQMPWPQFFDGAGWDNAVAKHFKIRSIPTMYLVDKSGILRDENAGVNLDAKIRALLKE